MKEYKKIKKLNINLRKGMFFLALILLCAGTAAFNTDAASKNAWVKKSGKTYYYNNKGKKVKGLKKIKGSYYYFSSKGVLYKKGWKTVKGGRYYFAKTNGKAYKGIKIISGKKYLFSTKCKLYGTGINAYGGKKYYTVKGMVKTGWQTVSGKTYYFNVKGIMQTGKWIDKVYYVNADGVMQKNCWIRLTAGNYYVDASGKKLSGCWITMGDYKYYFNTSGKNTHTVKIIPWEDEDTGGNADEPDGNGSSNDVIDDTLLNRSIYRSNIKNIIDSVNNKIASVSDVNLFEKAGYDQAIAIISDAQKMVDNYNSYTATELYNYYKEMAAKDCISLLKMKQILTYYPDQSKDIFDAINEYRRSSGIAELVWSDALSKTSRLEAGYHIYLYVNSFSTSSPLGEGFFRNHNVSQNSIAASGKYPTSSLVVTTWKNSSLHDPLLRDTTAFYGAVAYYSYNSTSGYPYIKIIYTAWSGNEEACTSATPEYYDIILNCATSNRTFE